MYLLDTHAWIWWTISPKRLLDTTRLQLSDPENMLLLSAASSWEIAIKYSKGRLPLPEPPDRFVPEQMRLQGVDGLAIEQSHAFGVASLPLHHKDPFDRLLIAQAQILGCPIVTSDPAFAAYDVELIPA